MALSLCSVLVLFCLWVWVCVGSWAWLQHTALLLSGTATQLVHYRVNAETPRIRGISRWRPMCSLRADQNIFVWVYRLPVWIAKTNEWNESETILPLWEVMCHPMSLVTGVCDPSLKSSWISHAWKALCPPILLIFGFASQDVLSPGGSLCLMPEDALNVCKGHRGLWQIVNIWQAALK